MVLALGLGAGVAHAGDAPAGTRRVSGDEILAAMRAEEGYDPTATTNAALFQGRVLVRLASSARARQPDGPPLFIHHADWFRAFLANAGLAEEQAPAFARLAYEHGQDLLLEHRPERVIKRVRAGPAPRVAMNVTAWWPESSSVPARFSFDDLLSVPQLRVTYSRLIRYRLLAFDDMMVYEDIRGLKGRPTSGLLGLLFHLIGEGRVVFSRIARAPDGLQLVYAQARKGFFDVTSTATITPAGITTKGLPPDRPDLKPIEARLQEPLKIDFQPWSDSLS